MQCKPQINMSNDSNSEEEQYENCSSIEVESQKQESWLKTNTTQAISHQVLNQFQELNQQYSELQTKQLAELKLKKFRTQSYFTEFEINVPAIDEAKLQTFKQFLEEFKRQDFTCLNSVWGQTFIQKINFILQHWQIYRHEYASCMKTFLNIVNRKIECIKIYEDFYPGLTALLARISNKIQNKGSKDLVECSQPKEDILFYHYIHEQQAKANKAGSYYYKQQNEERKLLGSYIAQNKYFHKNHQTWRLFFFIGEALKRYNTDASSQLEFQKQCKKICKFADLLLHNNQLTQPQTRLCCNKFFYMNFNIAPIGKNNLICRPINNSLKNKVEKHYLEKENKSTKQIEDRVQADQYNKQMKELMLDICSLLNQGGGVVLLQAKRIYLEVWVQGETILEDKKQFYVKLIENKLQAIKPTVKLNKQIVITFVPVVKNPYQYGYQTELEDEKDRAVNRNYIQGLYVPRISIMPSQAEKLYFYQSGNQQSVSAIYENFQRKEIRGKNLSKLKREKQQNFKIEEEDEQTRQLLGKDYLYVDKHTCPQPYKGHPMYMQQERVLNTKPEKQFKYLSMLVAHKSNHADIQRKLINKGIDCMVTDTFYKLKLKSSTSSAPLYHNIRFDQLLNQVGYNKEFEYNGRYILVVSVTTYIKILNKTNQAAPSEMIPKANMLTMLNFVQRVFPYNQQALESYKFVTENGEIEYYVKATSREVTLFIYYLLHHNGQKCIFKNPKSLEKIPIQQKMKRWELLYSVETKRR